MGGEEGFGIGSYMADILLFDDKVRSELRGQEEEELRAGRNWRILGGCQRQQHNRIRETTEMLHKWTDIYFTDCVAVSTHR